MAAWESVIKYRTMRPAFGLASALYFFAQGATVQALFILVYSHITLTILNFTARLTALLSIVRFPWKKLSTFCNARDI